jgi:hypothetical protein
VRDLRTSSVEVKKSRVRQGKSLGIRRLELDHCWNVLALPPFRAECRSHHFVGVGATLNSGAVSMSTRSTEVVGAYRGLEVQLEIVKPNVQYRVERQDVVELVMKHVGVDS